MPVTKAELEKLSDLWWTAERKGKKDPTGKQLAQALNRSATRREVANIPMRARNWMYYREMTGRPALSTSVYGMAKRPPNFVNYYSGFNFSGVKSGFAATMADVFTNRLLGHQTYVSMIPTEGDAEQNAMAQEIEEGIDLSDDQLGYQTQRATMCTEAFWYGGAPMYFGDDGHGNPMLEAVNPDEMLYANLDDPKPYDVIRRVWAKRTELLDEFKGNAEVEQAILNAPSAYPAFYFGRGEPDCTDIIPLLCGWTRPLSKSTPGRYVKVIGDMTIIDTEWKYPHPFEWWSFQELPGSIIGQGIAELLLQISQWIDGLLSRGVEADMRNGSGKWFVDENSNVNTDTLGNLDAAICTYLGKQPMWVTPEPVGQYWLSRLQFLMELGRSRVHVSEAAVKGEMPAGITAAVAIEKYAQIDDQNFLEKIGRLEEFDRRAAYQKIMLFKRLGTTFKSGRREFDWKSVKLNANFRIDDLEAYNVGRLSQTVAGRIQIVEQMRANNRIDDKTYNKFMQTPDIPGLFSQLNAETDDIEKQLDALVKSDDYIPPTPYMDFPYAKKAVETRYAREEANGADQGALDRLAMWRSTILSFLKQSTTPDAPPSPVAGAVPPVDPMAFTGITPPPVIPGAPGMAAPLEAAPPPVLPNTNTTVAPQSLA
jgi:hypothetical protein